MKINFIRCCVKVFIMVLCLISTVKSFSQSGIIVKYYNGTEQNYSIDTTGKLYFDPTSIFIVTTNAATPTSIPLSIIRKITFTNIVVPVKLIDFSVKTDKEKILLSWVTENEINASHFLIQRSVDGTNYENIGQVAANNNTTKNTYSFTDASPKNEVNYYRLKQVDANGKYTYSKVVTVTRNAVESITLFPNPANNYFVINSTSTEKLNVKIYAATGQLMISGNYTSGEQIAINKLTTGMYVAIIDNKPYKLIKQ